MDPKSIVAEIRKERPHIKSVYFVGCGASKAELYPGKYFLEKMRKSCAWATIRPTNSAMPRLRA